MSKTTVNNHGIMCRSGPILKQHSIAEILCMGIISNSENLQKLRAGPIQHVYKYLDSCFLAHYNM